MKKQRFEQTRNLIQLAAAALINGYMAGFRKGTIYRGKTKAVCLPVLNCYSCPGALGACPIGSLQSILSGYHRRLPFYVLGTLMLFGVLLGRAVCGFLCPFGWIQDLLYKIPVKKCSVPKKLDGGLRYLKYLILLLPVILLPLVIRDEFGFGTTWFCKYLCPAGTLEAGLPLLAENEAMRQLAGGLFGWKLMALMVLVVLSLLIYRPFCKYLCPLGAFYGFFNRFSFYRLDLDQERCVDCKACERACRMGVEVTREINSSECIRCGACADACPKDCIHREKGFCKKTEQVNNAKAPESPER